MRTSAFTIAVLLGAASLQAQIAPVGTPELLFPAGDSAFQRVWNRLDTLVYEGRGSLNIIHLGGSHVQAGILTDAVRRGLHAISTGLHGSVGWLYPYAVAGTNNPRS